MRGRFEDRVWEYRSDLYAPAAYRKGCRYQAFVPDGLIGERFSLPADLSGVVSDAEGEIRALSSSAVPAARSAATVRRYLGRALELKASWRQSLAASPSAPRADAAAWALIDVLVGQPVVNLPVAVALTGRVKSSVNAAIGQLVNVGVLIPLSEAARNRSWEAAGLLDLIAGFEGG